MRTELAAVCLVVALIGATAVHAQSQPTASEISELKIKCKKLSVPIAADEKENLKLVLGDDMYLVKPLSNYDVIRHHCYTELTITIWKKKEQIYNYEIRQLYDAETGEQLAVINHDLKMPFGKELDGFIYDKYYVGDKNNYNEVAEYFKQKMAPER